MTSRTLAPARLVSRAEDPWKGTELDIYRSNVRSVQRELRAVLAPYDLLLTDYKALHHVATKPTHPTNLAARLDITPAAATQLMDRLERRRLLRRLSDPSDRRATIVRLTPLGARVHGRVAREVRRILVELAAAMTPEGFDALRRGSEELRRVLASRAKS